VSDVERDRDALLADVARVRSGLAGTPCAPAPHAGTAAIDVLQATFGLTDFERDVLVLAAGAQIDPEVAAACEAAGAPGPYPTFGLALATLHGAHWTATTARAPLRRFRLVELASPSLTLAPVIVPERVLHFLLGVDVDDDLLAGVLDPLSVDGDGSELDVAARIARYVRALRQRGRWPLVELSGPAAAAQAVAGAACAHLGVGLLSVDAAALPVDDQARLRPVLEREAALRGSAILFDCRDVDSPATLRLLERLECIAFAVAPTALPLMRPVLRLDVERVSGDERRSAWRRALGPIADRLDGHLDEAVAQFDLDEAALSAVRAELVDAPDDDALARSLWDACRAQARPRLEDLALRIEPIATWDDLVLPAQQRATLQEIAAHVRHRARVYEQWGFAAKSARGLGISALFCGPSGTGKTMAAEVLANELALDLFRIDLSAVVSKYIGETEKNLRRVFDAAETGGAILLFDEADALFGKRTEVRDSHDRFANIEISYLLQRMEAYRGLAILTTNMHRALDSAFMRRIRFIVRFPFPDRAQRADIWRGVFPKATPVEPLDIDALAALDLAGGSIRNIALGAAFLAADAGEVVGDTHLQAATRSEFAKLGRAVGDRTGAAT
jgi:ATPase family associated with various cellular activities (AAA)/Winged helix domain, variant